MKENIIITIKDLDKFIIKEDSTIKELLKQVENSDDVIAATINGEVVELSYVLTKDTELKLIKKDDRIGRKIYRSGLKYLYITAIKELYGSETNVSLLHSIDKGIYTYLDKENITEETINEIKEKMMELVEKDLPIEKVSTSRKSAIKYFESIHEIEKVESYKQMSSEFVTLYEFLEYYNYFYYFMPVSSGILKEFDLTKINDHGIILQYPSDIDNKIPKYNNVPAVLNEFNTYREWCKLVNIRYLSDINNIVIKGKIKEFIQLNEMRQNEDLRKIGDYITENKERLKLILIGGPSSSGKTTTSKKIALELKARGINPFILSVDDYFLNRIETPRDSEGNYEYDIIEAIDINLFNEHLTKLLNGESVKIPSYNFVTGEKEYKNPSVSLKDRDMIIIEGLHTLNEKLTNSIKRENKLKIYISPFTPLGLDRHNHISTVDMRLIRRMVRDNSKRGYNAETTLKNWRIVRRAEEKYVFPYQNEADIVFNTALIYEIGILKTYAIPLLYSVKVDSEYYEEALRLINFLKGFFNIPVDILPNTSVLREFVGNSYFE